MEDGVEGWVSGVGVVKDGDDVWEGGVVGNVVGCDGEVWVSGNGGWEEVVGWVFDGGSGLGGDDGLM